MTKKTTGTAKDAPDTPARVPLKRVRITHYKVFTSIGRLIAGQREYLPADEADALIAKGHAAECPS